MRNGCAITAGCCLAILLLPGAWAVVIDFDELSGGDVPDSHGGLDWVDKVLGNMWEVDPDRPGHPSPCALFDSGELMTWATISSPEPIDFLSIDIAGYSGDVVDVYGEGPGGEYFSGSIAPDGVSKFHYEEQWLGITSLSFCFYFLFSGSAAIDNLTYTFSSERQLATIFEEDFESLTGDQDLLDRGWKMEHGYYAASDGGIWHLQDTDLDGGGVSGKYVISDSEAEGPMDPPRFIDERLISPEIDCADFTGVRLEFTQNLRVDADNDYEEYFNVHVSSDPEHQTWDSPVPVPFRKEADGSCFYPRSIDISELADGKKIKVRWRYTTRFDYWWAIDEVRVIGRPNVLEVTGLEADTWTGEVTIVWDAPDGLFSIEGSDDPSFSHPDELATGLNQKQWSGTDPEMAESQRYYRVRMD